MSEEELVFQLLEEERKARMRRIAAEKKITTEDCLVIGLLRLNKEIDGLYKRIDGMDKRIDGMDKRINRRIEETRKSLDKRIDWLIALIIGMWVTIMAALIPILLKLVGVI
jgi:tetrahydromethanopterin S-methyltransferase subunit G